MATKEIWQCPICKKEFEGDKISAWECCAKFDEILEFQCEHCGEIFEDEDDARKCCDCGKYDEIIEFQCEHCGEKFEIEEKVRRCSCHSPTMLITCPLCGKHKCNHIIEKLEGQMELFEECPETQ